MHAEHVHAHGRRGYRPVRSVAGHRLYTARARDFDLSAFLERFRDPALAATIAKQAGEPVATVSGYLDTFLNEANVGWDLAARVVRPGRRVLEVGSGLGFVSLALRASGCDVVGLEPVGTGFDFFKAARPVIRAAAADVDLEVLEIGVEELDPRRHGPFDAMFSVHVLEHVPDFGTAIAKIAAVLAPGGETVHICPNYNVPFEPHLGIPLIPGAPRATARVFKQRVAAQQGVWESVNFVSTTAVRRAARANGLDVEFDRGVMYDFVHRLGTDAVFAQRHASRPMRAIEALDRRGALRFLQRVPPAVATPMVFTLRRPAEN